MSRKRRTTGKAVEEPLERKRDLYDEKKCKKSLHYAAQAMCKQCCQGDRDAIKNCTAKPGTLAACPLWFHRPYRKDYNINNIPSGNVADLVLKLEEELPCQKIKELNNMTDEQVEQTAEVKDGEVAFELPVKRGRGRPAVPVNYKKCGVNIAKKSLAKKFKGDFYCDKCFCEVVPT